VIVLPSLDRYRALVAYRVLEPLAGRSACAEHVCGMGPASREPVDPAVPGVACCRMRPSGLVIYLNGIAAAGKSSLARAFCDRWPEPVLHVGLDWLTASMPERFFGAGPDADLGARWVSDEQGRLVSVDPGPFGLALLEGLPRLAAALARAGNHVVVDDVLLYPWRPGDVAKALSGLDAHFVEVRCSRDVARARSRSRQGRDHFTGMIDAYYDCTYGHDDYDITIDTELSSAEEGADLLVAHLRSGAEPGALARLRRQPSAASGDGSSAPRVQPGREPGS
jgi:chloramphenicol 3-O phosphotransferase